ncbi:MAG TPA: hypothetical protein VHB30_04610 [Solirubrobacteraceae bacterium]|nr:hypothetical protein [Solirubrobacteraceae bacterium]
MIVRIATEGQYDVPDETLARLNDLDNACVDAVGAGDEARFQGAFAELLALVRDAGTPVAEDELVESALILPPPDLSLEEAGEEFSGDGLLPDD